MMPVEVVGQAEGSMYIRLAVSAGHSRYTRSLMVFPFQKGRISPRSSSLSASESCSGSHSRVLALSSSASSQPAWTSGNSCAALGSTVGLPTISSSGAMAMGSSVNSLYIALPRTVTIGSPSHSW